MYDLEEISSIYKNHFNIDVAKQIVRSEIITPKRNRDTFLRIKAEYEENFKSHPNRDETRKKLYVSDKYIIHIQAVFPISDLDGLKRESSFYYPICTIEEIKRIENPACSEDILLKIRAESIADHPRLVRIFLKRRELHGVTWSLTEHYSSGDFDQYIRKLPIEKAGICKTIPAGYAPSREPHGFCLNTEHGQLVVLSEPLKHFLYYMCIHMFGADFGIPNHDLRSAFIIAARAMLLTETPDYDLDPRSVLPVEARVFFESIVRDQLLFIIGHEYAHALLGHFESKSSIGEMPRGILPNGEASKWYTPMQQQEFDADAASILQANYSEEECAHILNAATLFFLQLELYYAVSDYINPQHSPSKTHPDPIDRIWALRNTVIARRGIPSGAYSDDEVKAFIDGVTESRAWLEREFLPYEIELFERYGSVYLPTYTPPPLSDRFDY
jgi:hypothetical protein